MPPRTVQQFVELLLEREDEEIAGSSCLTICLDAQGPGATP